MRLYRTVRNGAFGPQHNHYNIPLSRVMNKEHFALAKMDILSG